MFGASNGPPQQVLVVVVMSSHGDPLVTPINVSVVEAAAVVSR